MSDRPLEVFEQVTSSPNIILILFGAIIWYLSFFVPWVYPFFTVAGFGLTCISTVQSAMTRPVTSAFPGLLMGGILQVLGYYMLPFGIIGVIFGGALIVFGGIMILFYGSSLALQRVDIPIVKNLEDFIDSKTKKKEITKKPEEKIVDVEDETTEESDSTEQ